jgi:glycerol dehydrogenase-like iron-containing ADH family enzyme
MCNMPGAERRLLTTGVADTVGKLTAVVKVNLDKKLRPPVSLATVVKFSPISLTSLVHHELRIQYLREL